MPMIQAAEKVDQFPGLDLLKFTMSIVVVALHSQLCVSPSSPCLTALVSPWYTSAVPTFFVVSSFLFFLKLERCGSPEDERFALCHYLKRLGIFYLFWFVIMLPVTVVVRRWYVHCDFVLFCRALLLGSTFRGSYFIMALMVGVPLVCLARKFSPPPALLFLCLAFHVPFRFPLKAMLPRVSEVAEYSFVPNLLWIAIGAMMVSSYVHRHRKSGWLPPVLFFAAMCWPVLDPVKPFVLAAFVVALVSAFLDIHLRNAQLCLWFRKMSILVFITHFPFNSALLFLGKSRFPVLVGGWLHFILILSFSILTSAAILRLRNKPGFSWLRHGL